MLNRWRLENIRTPVARGVAKRSAALARGRPHTALDRASAPTWRSRSSARILSGAASPVALAQDSWRDARGSARCAPTALFKQVTEQRAQLNVSVRLPRRGSKRGCRHGRRDKAYQYVRLACKRRLEMSILAQGAARAAARVYTHLCIFPTPRFAMFPTVLQRGSATRFPSPDQDIEDSDI